MSYPSYLDTVPALNAILQTLQNLQVVTYVSGVVVGAIETGYVGVNIVNSAIQVPIQIQSSLINVPVTGVVGISNTPLPVTGFISIENVPSVIVNTGYVGVNIVNSAIQVPVQIQSSLINVPITGVVGGTVNVGNTPLPVLNAGAQSVLDTVVWLNTTFYTASPPSTTYSTAIDVTPYETVAVLFNVVSLLGTGVTVSLNAYFTGLGIAYPLASQTLTSAGQALLTASVLPFNYIELGVTIYGSTVVLSAELVAKP